jgi:hypothetical protein
MDRMKSENLSSTGDLQHHSFYNWERLDRYEHMAGPGRLIKQREWSIMNEVLRARRADGLRCQSMIDVGTCTGRYLRWGRVSGFVSLCGIDHSSDAIAYCRIKLPFSCDLRQGDCKEAATFRGLANVDLISVMMGTFNHLSPESADSFLHHAAAVSGPGAQLVISTWAVPPSDLAIYSPIQAARLQSNGCTEILTKNVVGPWTLLQTYTTGALNVRLFCASTAGRGAIG